MRSKWTREFCEEAFYAVKKLKIPHFQSITLTIINITTQPRDYDNLAASAKPLIDGLVLAGVIDDDDPEHLTELRLRSQRVIHEKDQKVLLRIEM